MSFQLGAWALFIALLFISSRAAGETTEDEAKRHYRAGVEAYDASEFDQALGHFRAAYALRKDPEAWTGIISCLIDMGESVQAIAEFDAHVANDWTGLSQPSREQILTYLLKAGNVLGFGLLRIDTRFTGHFYLDGKQLPASAPQIPLRVPAGKHVVRLEAPGMAPAEETVEVRSGERSRVKLSPRKPFYLDMRLGLSGGGTTAPGDFYAGTNCGVYCLPTLNLLFGARLSIPIRGPFVVEIGGDYLHLRSTFSDWPNALFISSMFSLHAAWLHASLGMDVIRGRFRFQSRVGAGLLLGQSWETVTGIGDSLTTAMKPLGTFHARLGLSVQLRGVWFGAGIETMTTLSMHDKGAVPNVTPGIRGGELVGPDEKTRRQFGRLLLISPEISVGWSF